MFDHGTDPVVVEKYNVPQYPPGMCSCPSDRRVVMSMKFLFAINPIIYWDREG